MQQKDHVDVFVKVYQLYLPAENTQDCLIFYLSNAVNVCILIITATIDHNQEERFVGIEEPVASTHCRPLWLPV